MNSNDNNHANQRNPNNDAYWTSRGYDERPDGWQELVEQDDAESNSESDDAE